MGLVSIGPVTISHGDPTFASGGTPLDHGTRSQSIGGSCSWAAAHTLEELVANEHARTTHSGHTGVPAWLVFDDALLANFTGRWLLEGFAIDASQEDSLTADDAPFTLTGVYLPSVAAYLDATLATTPVAGATAATVVAIPPAATDPPGQITVLINGVATTRYYDPELSQP